MTRFDLDTVVAHEGLDRDTVVRVIEDAVKTAAERSWGPGRTLEARFEETTGTVEVHQVFCVVDVVEDTSSQVGLAQVGELGFQAGDEMLVQVFYLDEHAAEARAACEANPGLPSFQLLAQGLAAPHGPAWLRAAWPARRHPWRWGVRVGLPAFADALDRFERWVREVAPPHVVALIGPAPQEELAVLGTRASALAAFYIRFGRGFDGLDFFSAALVTPAGGADVSKLMQQLAADDPGFGRWDSAWLPFLSWEEDIYAVDLSEGANGRVVHWQRETRAVTVEAPSFEAWMGLLAACVDAGVLGWDNGITRDLALYRELQAHLLEGCPCPLP